MARELVSVIENKRKNYWINGALDFWQRNTSFTATAGIYGPDRLRLGGSGGESGTFSLARTIIPTSELSQLPAGIMLSGRWNQTASPTVNGILLEQRIEDVRTLAGKSLTFSLYAKKRAGSNTLVFEDPTSGTGPGIIQNFGSGGSTEVIVPFNESVGATHQLTIDGPDDTWVRHVFTVDVPSIDGKTIGANSYISIALRIPGGHATFDYEWTGFMVNEGLSAAPFERAGINLTEELQLCQRYFTKSYELSDVPGSATVNGMIVVRHDSSSNTYTNTAPDHSFQVTMRAAPTMVFYDSLGVANRLSFSIGGTNTPTGNGDTIASSGTNQNRIRFLINSSSREVHFFHYTADAEL